MSELKERSLIVHFKCFYQIYFKLSFSSFVFHRKVIMLGVMDNVKFVFRDEPKSPEAGNWPGVRVQVEEMAAFL